MEAYLRETFVRFKLSGGIFNVFKFYVCILNMEMFNHVTQEKCQESC